MLCPHLSNERYARTHAYMTRRSIYALTIPLCVRARAPHTTYQSFMRLLCRYVRACVHIHCVVRLHLFSVACASAPGGRRHRFSKSRKPRARSISFLDTHTFLLFHLLHFSYMHTLGSGEEGIHISHTLIPNVCVVCVAPFLFNSHLTHFCFSFYGKNYFSLFTLKLLYFKRNWLKFFTYATT